jgi:hypothetical protein
MSTPDTTTEAFANTRPSADALPDYAVGGLLDATTAAAAAPVIEEYTGVLAAADVFSASTTFWVMESIRLDLGYGSYVHP